MSALFFGLFGLVVGSFLNVVVLRRGTGRALTGRSACFSCGATLRWYDLIPVVSWLFLRGRCRLCGSSISIQYPLVEGTAALVFALIGGIPLPLTLFEHILFCLISALFIAIAAYDIRHTIIPDSWVYLCSGLALLSALIWLFSYPFTMQDMLMHIVFGPLATAGPLFALWLFSGGRWMGLGDAKLALGMGWLLGPVFGFVALLLSFIIGATVSVSVLLAPRIIRALRNVGITSYAPRDAGLTMRSEVPFGPFLVGAFFFVWFSLWYGIPLPLV